MAQNPYLRFRGKDLTLNDYLAIDRTVLANERSLLAYGRTSLAMLAIGGSCLKFFDSMWIQTLGVAFIGASIITMARGWARFRGMQKLLAAALEQLTGAPEHPLKDAVKQEQAATRESPPAHE